MDKFLIIDGNSLANRAFYAMPYLSNIKAEPSGAVFGFANILIKLITEEKPTFIAVAFDHARKTFRNEIFADYKGTRKETPPVLVKQFPVIKEMLTLMNIKIFEQNGIEADDIIGTIVKNSNAENIILSGDRDLLQLVDKHTTVWLTKKGVTELDKMDEQAIFEKYHFAPQGIVDLKALMGDTADNIPGVSGVGEKTALQLLDKYLSLDGVYKNIDAVTGKLKEKLETGKDMAYMSQKLAQIKTDCNIDFTLEECTYSFPFEEKVRDFFEYWGFNSFLKRGDIFSGERREVRAEEKVETFTIESLEDVEKIVSETSSQFAYNLQDMQFSPRANVVYVLKKEVDLFSNFVDAQDVLRKLKGVFENEKVEKITNASKSDIKILGKLGIKLVNFFDVEIARYCACANMKEDMLKKPENFFKAKENLSSMLNDKDTRFIYEQIEIPLTYVLADMEEKGFKIDPNILGDIDKKISAEIDGYASEIYALAGETFNINSPKQVAEILYDKLALVPYPKNKRSTNSATLEDLRFDNEIVDLILKYRKVHKLKSTYINTYKEICATSGNVIHTTFNQTLTSTGRLSSSEPNMQNIPTRDEEGKNLRKIFISKFKDGVIVSADYNQIELRLLANMADEQSMIKSYEQGIDIHTKTASEIFGVDVENVTPSMRRDAKAVNFGIIYGISDYGLSQNIKTTRMRAKIYMDNYFSRYPKIKNFMDGNIRYAKEHGYIKTLFGRIRMIGELSSSNYNVVKFGERVAMNMPLQGTASDIIKLAMIKCYEKLQGLESHIILQIHDELIIDTKKDELENVIKIVKESMENVKSFKVPLTVNVGYGATLFDCK